jgi:hypothetical protein
MIINLVDDLNAKIAAASRDKNSPLLKVSPVVDPSNEIADVLAQAVDWNILSREWNLNTSDFILLHKKSKALLQALQTHLPDRVGGAEGWNFEKSHSILHKVREIVLWGWTENTSCQGPEHAHKELIKNVAHLTNNKDIFLCILRYHCRRGFLQQYEQILTDMLDVAEGPATGQLAVDSAKIQQALEGDKYFSISCELGLRYPTLKVMINRDELHIVAYSCSGKYIHNIKHAYI